MSNSIVRAIVENIVSDKFDTLKEDLSKAVSSKAVTVLESKKAMVGKNFFYEAAIVRRGADTGVKRTQIGRIPVAGRKPEDVDADIKKMRDASRERDEKHFKYHARGSRPKDPDIGQPDAPPTRPFSPKGGKRGPGTKYLAVYAASSKPPKSKEAPASASKDSTGGQRAPAGKSNP